MKEQTPEHHFVLKEDGNIYWIEDMPLNNG